MPKKETGNNSDNKPQKPASESDKSAAHGVAPHGSQESVTGNNPTNQSHNRNKPRTVNIGKIPKIDVIEGIEANKIAKSANNISRWSVFVSALLFAITLLIAYQAIRQSKAASDSVALARQTYLADSVYKHKTDSFSKISDRIKTAREDSVFNAQKDFYTNTKKGVEAQIESVQTQQEEFNIENKPIIQAFNFILDPPVVGKSLIIRFEVKNYGKQPVKCIYHRIRCAITNVGEKLNWSPFYNLDVSGYMFGDVTNKCSYKLDDTLTNTMVDFIRYGDKFIFIGGDFKFQNIVTSETTDYEYEYKLYFKKMEFSAEGIVDTMIMVSRTKSKKSQ